MANYGITIYNQSLDEMTAIAIVCTKAGLIMAADGLARLEQDSTQGTDHQQKIFLGRLGTAEIAWSLAGSVVIGDFSLVDEVKKSMEATNNDGNKECGTWFEIFNKHLRNSVSEARNSQLIPPFTQDAARPEPNTFATIMMAGYFYRGKASMARIRLEHKNGVLVDPLPFVQNLGVLPRKEASLFHGSMQILLRYLDIDPDKRFRKYFRPHGPTLDEGLANATGYIEACSSDLARKVDPAICGGIGGHIHAAAVTPSGFRWLIAPKPGGNK